MKRIGLLGGTFDPVHNGHIELARNAHEQFSLDEVWLMVSPDPPHKKDHNITAFRHRYKMVLLAAGGSSFLVPSDYETGLPQPSYTAQTLKALKHDFPDDRFFFIIGQDSLDAFDSWYHPQEIASMTELIVSVRNEGAHNRSIIEQSAYLKDRYGASVLPLHSDPVDVSSTIIRQTVRSGGCIKGMVPSEVEKYIWTENLYII